MESQEALLCLERNTQIPKYAEYLIDDPEESANDGAYITMSSL